MMWNSRYIRMGREIGLYNGHLISSSLAIESMNLTAVLQYKVLCNFLSQRIVYNVYYVRLILTLFCKCNVLSFDN